MTNNNIIHLIGDLFDSKQPALGHGVNTEGVMGSGIAVLFKNKFPEIFAPYKAACQQGKLRPGTALPILSQGKWIFNIASQQRPGRDARLEWLSDAFRASLDFCLANNISGLALPRIGAGIGGLDWNDAVKTIENVVSSNPRYEALTIELWTHPKDIKEEDKQDSLFD